MDLMLSTREYGNNKFERPFSNAYPLHITLKSKYNALGKLHSWLGKYIVSLAKRFNIRIFHFSVNGNHIHLLLQAKTRMGLNAFLRVLAGVTARRALGAEKGRAKGVQFWENRPYSRVLTWGREFRNVLNYLERNILEFAKRISYTPRKCAVVRPLKVAIEQSLILRQLDTLSAQMRLTI